VSAPGIGIRPYIDLRYFEERDAPLFYGRDEHAAELLTKVAANHFVAVMGSSGCGKSSLVRAGLLPELRSGMIPKAGPRWKIVEFKPGRAPLRELADAMRTQLGVERAQELIEEGPLGIPRAVAQAKLSEKMNVLVIADQFEEIFRFQREERALGGWTQAAEQCYALVRRLLDAAAQSEVPIFVLLVMRSDYLGDCAQFPDLPERMSQSLYLVPRLRRDQLQEAITAPVGNEIEPAVVQRLLAEVGTDPDQLPRLQHLLGRMWDRARGGPLTMKEYNEVGAWENALEKHLEEVYTSLGNPGQVVCARVFQQLSDLDNGRAVRRRALLGDLIDVCGPNAPTVVEAFRAEGFLIVNDDLVDITHECILRAWTRMREWLELEDRNARRLNQLSEAAKDSNWQPGLPVEQKNFVRELAGLTLQNLVTWRNDVHPTAAWSRRYISDDDFEVASNYLAWSEAREKEQKQRARWRTRLVLALVGTLVLGLTVATLIFYRLKTEALRAAVESKARELAALSTESLADDPEKSILLALEAVNTTRRNHQPIVVDAESTLHQAILGSLLRMTLHGHTSDVYNAAYSPDGKLIASVSGDKTAKLWDAATGKELLTLQGHAGLVWGVAFSPDSSRVATSSFDRTIRVWDTTTGKELFVLRGHAGNVYGLMFSPDGKHLTTASSDRTAKVWDAESGTELMTLRGHSNEVYGAIYSSDGTRIATASRDQTAKIWNAKNGKELVTLRGHAGAIRAVAFSPDSTYLATASWDQTAKIWDAHSGRELRTLQGHSHYVRSVAFSPDGKRLATCSLDQMVKVWDSETGKELRNLSGHKGDVDSVGFSPDGKQIISTSQDHTVKVWDAEGGKELLALRGHTGKILSVAYSPDGKRLATSSDDKTARIWDAATGKEIFTLRGHSFYVRGAVFSPDGMRLATASLDGTAKIWDAETGVELLTIRGHASDVYSVAFSPDGRQLATSSKDQTARIWDTQTGKELQVLRGHSGIISCVIFSPSGKYVATASADRTARIWDVESGKTLLTFQGHLRDVATVTFSSDGKRLATTSLDGTAKIWDATNGKELLALKGHNGIVFSAAFSPDGEKLVTASRDQATNVWDTKNGDKLVTLRGHTGDVYGVVFSPDGRRLADASQDGTVQVYAFDMNDLLNLARTRVTRSLTADECQHFLQEKSCPPGP
jgi:WD40 repeat protein/energy-coupling factor transporter ATP-binding protein EcfA2